MKKTIYIAFVAALCMLASCTKQSIGVGPIVSGSSRSYIFFEPEVYNEVSSKAALLTEGNLPAAAGTAFGVLGYYGNTALFNGVTEVKRAVNAGPFDYEGLVAWQDNTTNHDFYAVYPYSLHSDVKPNNANPYLSYTQPTSDDDMIDVLTAKTSTKKTSDNNVSLTFHHRLWALYVQIKNAQTEGLNAAGSVTNQPTMKVTGVKVIVEQFPTTAYIYLDKTQGIDYLKYNNQVVLSSTPSTYTLPVPADGDVINKNGSKTYGPLLFLPVAAGIFKYKLEITYEDSRSVSSTHSTELMTSKTTFEEGKKYTLTINKTNDTFVLGSYFDPDEGDAFQPGDWSDANVDHEFN